MLKIKEKIREFRNCRLVVITCIDSGRNFELYYHFDKNDKVHVKKFNVPKANPVVESISDWFSYAVFFEMETHDFFRVEFEGNPHLHEKLFLADSWKKGPSHLKGENNA